MKQRGRKSQYDMYGNIPARPYGGLRLVETAPAHLGDVEKRLWKSICEDSELESPAGTAVLLTGLEAHMRARLATTRCLRPLLSPQSNACIGH